jgi:hypothetical protein
MSVGTFGIEKEFLHDLLREVRDGQLEQGEWVVEIDRPARPARRRQERRA